MIKVKVTVCLFIFTTIQTVKFYNIAMVQVNKLCHLTIIYKVYEYLYVQVSMILQVSKIILVFLQNNGNNGTEVGLTFIV